MDQRLETEPAGRRPAPAAAGAPPAGARRRARARIARPRTTQDLTEAQRRLDPLALGHLTRRGRTVRAIAAIAGIGHRCTWPSSPPASASSGCRRASGRRWPSRCASTSRRRPPAPTAAARARAAQGGGAADAPAAGGPARAAAARAEGAAAAGGGPQPGIDHRGRQRPVVRRGQHPRGQDRRARRWIPGRCRARRRRRRRRPRPTRWPAASPWPGWCAQPAQAQAPRASRRTPRRCGRRGSRRTWW